MRRFLIASLLAVVPLAAVVLAADKPEVRAALQAFRARQTQDVLDKPDPRSP